MTERKGDQTKIGLSEAGARRRDAMLAQLQDELPRVRAKRRASRRVAGGVSGALVIALVAMFWPRPPIPSPATDARIVSTEVGIEARYLVQGQAHVPEYVVAASSARGTLWVVHTTGVPDGVLIDDEELLQTLADIGRPAGLARTEGRVWLTASVVGPSNSVEGGPPSGAL